MATTRVKILCLIASAFIPAQASTFVQAEELISVKDFGAVGDGVADDTASINSALNSGATEVVIPKGTYKVTGLTIEPESSLTSLRGLGSPTILLDSAADRVILLINKSQFVSVESINFRSNGTKSDGNNTVGIKAVSKSFMSFKRLRFDNFSLRAMQIVQCVYWGLEDITILGCTYGLSFENSGSIPCTTVRVNRAYIVGCTRGIFQQSGVSMTYNNIVLEYCGSSTSKDGAFHATGGGALLQTPYWEANNRNIVAHDTGLIIENSYPLAATAPDLITYYGAAHNHRGSTQIHSTGIKTRFLLPDDIPGYDLNFGENLVAPLSGGSVRWGESTTETIKGTVPANTWTTIKSFGKEMNGVNNDKAAFLYTVYGGLSDLGTGFDFGTIFNDTVRSFSGSVPSWLRLNGQNLQINLKSSSCGLNYKLVLIRTFPGS